MKVYRRTHGEATEVEEVKTIPEIIKVSNLFEIITKRGDTDF
jgi:hypothetical protein